MPEEVGGFPLLGPFPPPDHPGWRQNIELMLRALWSNTDRAGDPLTPDLRQQLENVLFREQGVDPEAFLTIQESVAGEFGFVSQGGPEGTDFQVELMNSLIDGLTGALSGRARDTLQNIVENVTVTGEETITTERRETEFVDIPTPEEVLDDFMLGLSTWVDTALREGEISVLDYNFVLRNPERFLTPYLAELGRRAEAGEVPFTVVGLEGAAERLGERFGGTVTEQTQRVAEQERISDTEINELIESTAARLTPAVPGAEAPDAAAGLLETIENVFREHRETTTSTDFRTLATTITTEDIFGRPRLGIVRDPSPLDFLRGAFPASTLANIVAGEGGPPPARAGGARAVQPSGPRRLGG
jgi:hypothetical protein